MPPFLRSSDGHCPAAAARDALHPLTLITSVQRSRRDSRLGLRRPEPERECERFRRQPVGDRRDPRDSLQDREGHGVGLHLHGFHRFRMRICTCCMYVYYHPGSTSFSLVSLHLASMSIFSVNDGSVQTPLRPPSVNTSEREHRSAADVRHGSRSRYVCPCASSASDFKA